MDITELILNDHHEQRRMFAFLDDIDRGSTEALSAIWGRLRVLLDVHAAAEESVFYPHLLKIGTGAGGKDSAASEVKDVIKDHNEIRTPLPRSTGTTSAATRGGRQSSRLGRPTATTWRRKSEKTSRTSATTPTTTFGMR